MSPTTPSDVTCRCIMVTEFSVLSPGMTVVEYLETLVENRMFSMPVVDASGKYLGHF